MNLKIYQSVSKNNLPEYQKEFDSKKLKDIIPYPYTPGLGTEYDLFKEIHEKVRPTEPWGLVSSKFEIKCPVSLSEFIDFAKNEFNAGADCVFINPMLVNESLFLDVWEQGRIVGHTGLDTIQKHLTEKNYINQAPMGIDSFAFCNYFIGNHLFWDKYFQYVDTILNDLDMESSSGTQTGAAFSGNANYHKNPTMNMKPFVVERLLSSFIEKYKNTLSFRHYRPEISHYELKCGRLYGQLLYQLSQMKNASISSKSALQSWHEIRKKIINNRAIFFGLLHLDDPNEEILKSIVKHSA